MAAERSTAELERFLAERADHLLRTAALLAGSRAIAQMTVTTRATTGGATTTTTAEEWSYGDQWRSVTYSRPGHPVYDEGFSSSSVFTLVSYLTRAWARQAGLGRPSLAAGPAALGYAVAPRSSAVPVPDGCRLGVAALPLLLQPGLPGIGFSASSPPATVARALHAEISCGALTVAGRQRVDGIEAIELTSRAGSPVAETIWVSPGTYLPVRIDPVSGPGRATAAGALPDAGRPARRDEATIPGPSPGHAGHSPPAVLVHRPPRPGRRLLSHGPGNVMVRSSNAPSGQVPSGPPPSGGLVTVPAG